MAEFTSCFFIRGEDARTVFDPSPEEIEAILRDPSIGQKWLGDLTFVCHELKNGKRKIPATEGFDIYLGHAGSAVVSEGGSRFLVRLDGTGQKLPLPLDQGEIAEISDRFFLPLPKVIDLVQRIADKGTIESEVHWDDPDLFENTWFPNMP